MILFLFNYVILPHVEKENKDNIYHKGSNFWDIYKKFNIDFII